MARWIGGRQDAGVLPPRRLSEKLDTPPLGESARAALAPWLTSRVALFVLCAAGLWLRPMAVHHAHDFHGGPWLDGWARWDAHWYWTIFDHGYRYNAAAFNNTNFFPLFPLVAGALSWPLGLVADAETSFLVAAVLLSHALFYVALVGLHQLGAARFGRATAQRALWLLALYPYSFFFSACYTESLFLALAVWTFVLAQRRAWLAASIVAALCGATRITGVTLVPALALEFIAVYGWRPRPGALVLGIAPLGFAVVAAYFWWRLGDPLLFLHSQAHFGGRTISLHHVPEDFRWLLTTHDRVLAANIACSLALLPATLIPLAWCARHLGAGWLAYATASLAMVFLTGAMGTGRYVSVVFPCFFAAALLLRRASPVVAALFVPLLAWFTFAFSHWGPID